MADLGLMGLTQGLILQADCFVQHLQPQMTHPRGLGQRHGPRAPRSPELSMFLTPPWIRPGV